MKTPVVVGLLAISIVGPLLWFANSARNHSHIATEADALVLLIPDAVSFSDPRVTVWLDAGSEEGLHLLPMHDSDFVGPLFGTPVCAGVILPDSVHQSASDQFIDAIRQYVKSGGHLMLVYDAGTQSLNGTYAAHKSRLSDLAGVSYALYDSLRNDTTQWGIVKGTVGVMKQLGVPPGKYYPFDGPAMDDNAVVEFRRYKYGSLQYPSFVTDGTYSGQVLLRAAAGTVAGSNAYGRGSVLFVNVPLGSLKGDTDGLLLHSFLKYFAAHELSLPYLMPVPDGIGGLVLNWHIDSNAAIKALVEMNSWSILKQGPFSIDVTAGPDAMQIGDGRGFDLGHNPTSEDVIREYMRLGYEIGSHGGWIHNYFAAHVDRDNPKELEQYLVLNNAAVQQITGKPVREYAAPNGNQPEWVTHWLDTHGVIAYYYTGDTGMGPTQDYLNGHRAGQNVWAFPVTHLDRAASFEEMSAVDGYGNEEVQDWLDAVSIFTVTQQQARLIYFHPPGAIPYHGVFDKWMETTAQLKADGHFRWYTMAELAAFLNVRKDVQWTLSENNGVASLAASQVSTLADESWSFPSERFLKPEIVQGSATVTQVQNQWVVVAGEGKSLKVEAPIAKRGL